jgi:hypothetical protein
MTSYDTVVLTWRCSGRSPFLAALGRALAAERHDVIRTVDTLEINQALRIYLDADPRSGGVRPSGMVERIRSKYGSRSPTVLEEIKRVIGGLYDEEEVVGLKSLQDIGAFAEARARSRRPDLEDDVCKAIGNYISYSYR